MVNKTLVAGIVGFLLGGLLVSIAATTFDKPKDTTTAVPNPSSMSSMSMSDMTANLKGKTGDEYDKAFIAEMIAHHEGAVAMAKLSANNAKHDELKKLSEDIIIAQEKEISNMKQWQVDWGYTTPDPMSGMNHTMR
jgi:uncharacterized protein (DUF305 family)